MSDASRSSSSSSSSDPHGLSFQDASSSDPLGAKGSLSPWSELPVELLVSISNRLASVVDYIAFRSVCRWWRAAAQPRNLPPQFPCVTLPYMIKDGISAFFSLSDNTVYHLDLPETRGCRCFGSAHGWLLMFDGSPVVFLLNPLTRDRIQLPPVTTFPSVVDFRPSEIGKEYLLRDRNGRTYTRSLVYMRDCTVKKAVLSCDPALGADCIVMVMFRFRKKLAFCKVGAESWTEIGYGDDEQFNGLSYPMDMRHYRERIYMVFRGGRIAACDAGPSARVTLSPSIEIPYMGELSLAELDGELLVVTCGFGVFALNLVEEMEIQTKESIVGNMLFVGETQTLTVPAAHFPEQKEDCIYYTHASYVAKSYLIGVLRLKDDGMEWPFRLGKFQPHLLPHIWFTPSLGST